MATQKTNLLLKNGQIFCTQSQQFFAGDVQITNGNITAIGENLSPQTGSDFIELTKDHWILPGLMDLNTHGQSLTTVEDAALAGGFTTVCLSPETKPMPDNLASWAYLNAQTEKAAMNLIPLAAMTQDLKSEALTEFKSLQAKSCLGLSNGLTPVTDASIMQRALQSSRDLDLPVFVHAEDPQLSGDGCVNEGYQSTLYGLRGIPATTESTVIARDLALLRATGGRLHFRHLTSAASVQLIGQAKADGLAVTADVTPHHLCLTDETIGNYDPDFKINPTLRTETDRQALIDGIKDGTIDCIATDHTPFIPDEKAFAFDIAPYGVIGLETAFSACYTELVIKQNLDPAELIKLFTAGPSGILKRETPALTEDQPANLLVFDTSKTWTVDPANLTGTARNTCFKAQILQGAVQLVVAKGQLRVNKMIEPVTA